MEFNLLVTGHYRAGVDSDLIAEYIIKFLDKEAPKESQSGVMQANGDQ